MKNYIVKHLTCNECQKDIPVWEYAPYNHDDYMRVRVNGQSVALCTACWSRLFDRIQFMAHGWELQAEVQS